MRVRAIRPAPRRRRALRRFFARYIGYLETLGYVTVLLIVAAVAVCFFWRVDDRITAGGVEIRPHPHPLLAPYPVRVTRVLVRDRQSVRKGDPLVELARLPRNGLAEGQPARAADRQAPRRLLRAPFDGIVVMPSLPAGATRDAGTELMKLLDPRDLRLTARLEGETVADARPGQPARIRNLVAGEDTGTRFHGDTVLHHGGSRRSLRLGSRGLLAPGLKQLVRDAIQRPVTQRNDLPFQVTEVTAVEVTADLEARAASAPATAVHRFDPPPELALPGQIVEGRHQIEIQLADLPAATTQGIAQQVARQLEGKTVAVPRSGDPGGAAPSLETMVIEQLRHVRVIAQVEAENRHARGATPALKREAARGAWRGAATGRRFEAVIRLTHPPPFLQERVRELAAAGKTLKADVEVVTGTRPVALLLLKR